MRINIQNPLISKTSNINQDKIPQISSHHNAMSDKVAFSGTIIRPVKDNIEINELVDLFFNALKHNLEPGKKLTFFDKIGKFIAKKEFSIATKLPNSITEVVKAENKLAGGYSITVNKDATAHLGFITLSPEFMKTRTGIEILKGMGRRICENAELNNVETLTWTTNERNKPVNLLLKRIGAHKTRNILMGESEYQVSIRDLKKKLSEI